MSINWIYDLDLTLYSYKGNPKMNEFNYNKIISPDNLKQNIRSLPGKKLLFTNGNLLHTLACIKKLNLERTFHKIACRELTGFKPDIKSYINLYNIGNLSLKDICYFFEDTVDNLITAKSLGWKTVYIGKKSHHIRRNYLEIDYGFPDITSALVYFQNEYL